MILIVLKSIVYFIAITFLWVLILKWVNPPITYLMLKRKFQAIYEGAPNRINYNFVPYDRISDHLKVAVMASEDQKFPSHIGFDFEAIDNAMEHNKKSKRKHGASTISQQTAKNVFLWDGRNFIRKGLEAYFTTLIEFVWGKERILEVYLNVAEMGNLTFGADAAAHKYFKKSAQKLSLDEAASIVAVLPNPILFKVKKPTKFIIKRKAWIINQYNALGGRQYLKEIK